MRAPQASEKISLRAARPLRAYDPSTLLTLQKRREAAIRAILVRASLMRAAYDRNQLRIRAVSDNPAERAHVVVEIQQLLHGAHNGGDSVGADQHNESRNSILRPGTQTRSF